MERDWWRLVQPIASPMNTQRVVRGTLVAMLIAAVGGSAWQFAAVERNRLAIDDLHSSITSERRILRELVNRRGAREAKADAVTPTAIPDWAADDVTPTINESIYTFLRHVEDLKVWFEANSEHQIPEMRFLEEHDWIKESVTADLSTEEGARQFAASLRAVAVGRFAEQVLKGALSHYATEHAGLLPLAVSELEPLLANPADRPILDRYEVLVTGLSTTVAAENRGVALKPASIIDPVYDRAFYTGPHGGITFSSGAPLLDLAYGRAQAAYANTHSGELMSDTETLLPYFSDPTDGRKYVERRKKADEEFAARRAADERAK